MKKIITIALLTVFSLFGFSQESPQNLIESEQYLAMTPYESHIMSCNELLNFYTSMDESTLASLGVAERQQIECQKKCLAINIQISRKYQALDPSYTLKKSMEGIQSKYIDSWSDEIGVCDCGNNEENNLEEE